MALTRPTYQELFLFWGDDAPNADSGGQARATFLIDAATRLLELSTDLTKDPTDDNLLWLVKYAILDYAIFMWSQREDLSENYNNFTGETIGSYTYSKKQTQAAQNGTTGVDFWDRLMMYLTTGAGAPSLVDSTEVFHKGYGDVVPDEWLLHDPSGYRAVPQFGVGDSMWPV